MKKLISIGFALILVLKLSAQKSAVFVAEGSAIHGYDPVAYFKEGRPVKGSKYFSFEWSGTTWNFSNLENLESFKTNPAKYAPQYGGYCAYGAYEGHKAPTEPDAWTIVDGRLYFNYNLKVRELWRNKKEEKIQIADKNWPDLKDKE